MVGRGEFDFCYRWVLLKLNSPYVLSMYTYATSLKLWLKGKGA